MTVHIAGDFGQSPPQHKERRMDFEYSDRTKELLEKLNKFMDEVIYNEAGNQVILVKHTK